MEKKAIFLDVDGTLVANHGKMTEQAKKAITLARNQGHKVFICTGRNKIGIRNELEEVNFDGFIASAGSYIEVADEVVHSRYYDRKLIEKACDVFNRNNIVYNYECTDITYMSPKMMEFFVGGNNEEATNSEMERLKAEQSDKFNVRDMNEYDGRGIHKISFIAMKQEDFDHAFKELKENFNFVVHDMFGSKNINGEIMSKLDNKGTGIKRIVDYLNIDMEDTIGFGDSMNDYEMIDAVKCGVVMDNGSARLKEIADRICKSVDEDGVYYEFIDLGII